MNKNQKQGFTLIELLVVVLIIGILAAVALPQYQKAVEKARMTEALTNISNIEKGIDVWLLENDFPATGENVYFIGEHANATKYADLDIDMKSGLTCKEGANNCYSKVYHYSADCDSSTCSISASPISRSYISLYSTKRKNSDVWDRSYDPNGDDNNDLGEQLGKSLEVQGWRNEC